MDLERIPAKMGLTEAGAPTTVARAGTAAHRDDDGGRFFLLSAEQQRRRWQGASPAVKVGVEVCEKRRTRVQWELGYDARKPGRKKGCVFL